MRTPRSTDVLRLGLGVVALVRPEVLLRLGSTHQTTEARSVARVLGGRYIAQAATGVCVDRPWLPKADAAVEVLHAITMLALATLDRPHRRLALISASVAAAVALADLRNDKPPGPSLRGPHACPLHGPQ